MQPKVLTQPHLVSLKIFIRDIFVGNIIVSDIIDGEILSAIF